MPAFSMITSDVLRRLRLRFALLGFSSSRFSS
jgi:hypothetical protein